MARQTVTYGAKNLNDGVTWFLMPGADFGERLKTWDERRSYAGNVAQYNVTEANLIHMSLPFRIEAADVAGLHTEIDALNVLIDAGAQDLVHDDGSGEVTYSCAHSSRVPYPKRDVLTQTCHVAFVDFLPVRYP